MAIFLSTDPFETKCLQICKDDALSKRGRRHLQYSPMIRTRKPVFSNTQVKKAFEEINKMTLKYITIY